MKLRLQAFAERGAGKRRKPIGARSWQRDDVDIVDISVPTHLHHDIAVAAAEAGKHIFCEKPFAVTLEEAQEMYDSG